MTAIRNIVKSAEAQPVPYGNVVLFQRHTVYKVRSPLFSRQTGIKIKRLLLGLSGPDAIHERNGSKLLSDMFHGC